MKENSEKLVAHLENLLHLRMEPNDKSSNTTANHDNISD